MKFHQIRKKKPMTLKNWKLWIPILVELVGEYSFLELVLNQILNNFP